jgi:meso-butanediol dehydrogenase/(S,S)-butanediol dehydrogenase/diacetyl reductase
MDSAVAVITGAGGGIGRATAIELARRGHRLVLCGRRRESLDETARLAGGGLAIAGDVTDSAQIDRLMATTLAEVRRIDAVIHCAGLAPVLNVEQTSIEQWHAVIDTNLSAAFYLAKAVWPIFKRQGGGAIVNISSLAARDPFPGFAAYAAAKAGVNLLSLSLAREGAAHNIRVYTIAPGAVETKMFRAIMSPQQYPTEKTLDPADVAKVIAQCVAGDLQYTSGEVIWLHKTV